MLGHLPVHRRNHNSDSRLIAGIVRLVTDLAYRCDVRGKIHGMLPAANPPLPLRAWYAQMDEA